MYAIRLFPEAMQHRFLSARVQLENNSEVVRSARRGYAEKGSLVDPRR